MRQVNTSNTLAGSILAVIAGLASTGCQQPTGPGMAQPLIPANPMSGPTRIPPPPTGSIGGGNTYVQPTPTQGQVSAGLPVNDLVAAAINRSGGAANRGAPIGSGVSPSGQPASGAYAAPAPVQQVGFQTPATGNSTIPTAGGENRVARGSGIAPTIPAEAIAGSSYASPSAPLRPHLRGMEPIDLTPTEPPVLRPVDSGNWAVVGENQTGQAASLPSTRPLAQGAGGTGSNLRMASRADSGAADEYRASGGDASGNTSLQWRRPQVAR